MLAMIPNKGNSPPLMSGGKICAATMENTMIFPQKIGNLIYLKLQLYHSWVNIQRILCPTIRTLD